MENQFLNPFLLIGFFLQREKQNKLCQRMLYSFPASTIDSFADIKWTMKRVQFSISFSKPQPHSLQNAHVHALRIQILIISHHLIWHPTVRQAESSVISNFSITTSGNWEGGLYGQRGTPLQWERAVSLQPISTQKSFLYALMREEAFFE